MMKHYFLVTLPPPIEGKDFTPALLAQTQDLLMILFMLYHYTGRQTDPEHREHNLGLYSVDATLFKPGIVTDIDYYGKPRPDTDIAVLAVSVGGQSVFMNQDTERGFVKLMHHFRELPPPQHTSPADRVLWQVILGIAPSHAEIQPAHSVAVSSPPPVATATAANVDPDVYFTAPLRNWITGILSKNPDATDQQIVRKLTTAGIDEDIATALVETEREKCLSSKGKHVIDFIWYEPDDDRLFSASHMSEFAGQVAEAFMAAASSGKNHVDGVTLDRYIDLKLDAHEGDGSHSTWIAKKDWPKLLPPPAAGKKTAARIPPKKTGSKGL